MSRKNRRANERRKKTIRRRRILLFLFILILLPIIYGGSKSIVKIVKSSYSNIINKDVKSQKTKKENKKIKKSKDDEETSQEVEIANMKLLSVGDIMFHMPQVRAAYLGDGRYDFTDSFVHVKSHIEDADISIANFESVTGGNDKKFSGFPQFNSPKETLYAIKESGFDIISTANNHSLDGGKPGLVNTIKNAREYGLKTIGTYEELQTEYLIEEKNGIKLGFLSYTYGLNGLEFYLSEEELSYMVNLIDEEKIKKDIDALKDKTDMIVVSVHWGEEYAREPNQSQIDLGHKMVDWGANIILGSHPHVLQKTEIVEKNGRDNFIIYSMGNFFSNQRKETMGNSFTEDGVMLEIEIEKDITNENTIIKEINFLPTWVDKYRENEKDVFRVLSTRDILDGSLDIKLDDKAKSRIKKSQEDSLETLDYK